MAKSAYDIRTAEGFEQRLEEAEDSFWEAVSHEREMTIPDIGEGPVRRWFNGSHLRNIFSQHGRWRLPVIAGAVFVLVVILTTVSFMTVSSWQRSHSPMATAEGTQIPETGRSQDQHSETSSAHPTQAMSNDSGNGKLLTAELPVSVHLVGAVVSPGVYTVPEGTRLGDVVEKAGGATGEAELARVNLARAVQDGEQIHVPSKGEEDPSTETSNISGVKADSTAAPSKSARALDNTSHQTNQSSSATAQTLNLNQASEVELQELPGVGPVTAREIVQWREQNGPFSTVDALDDIPGIGAKTLEKLRPFLVC